MYPNIPILFDLHTHSISSGHHTTDTITDLARTAADRGLTLLGISDHGPAMAGAPSAAYFRGLARGPKERFGLRLLYGVELNILDEQGSLDLPTDILATLDYAAAGLHAGSRAGTSSGPGTSIYQGHTAQDAITGAYLATMANPHVHIIAHCDDPKFPADYQALAAAAKTNHVLLELNEASLAPNSYRGDAKPAARELLRWCAHYDHPILLGSDSHGRAGVGVFTHCQALLAEANFPSELVLNQWPERVLEFLRRK